MYIFNNTPDNVKLFNEFLQKHEQPGKFSLSALLFNSFYYLYWGIGWKLYLFYALLPIALLFLFVLLCRYAGMEMSMELILTCSFLFPRLLAAFRAPKDFYKYAQNYVVEFKNAAPEADVMFFSVSCKRLFLLNLLSCGLYHIYWSYRNWKCVRASTGEDISPIVRSWFFEVFCLFPLLNRMYKNISRYKKLPSWFRLYIVAYVVIYIAFVIIPLPDNIFCTVLSFLWLFVLLSLGLFPLQKEINEHNLRINPEKGGIQKIVRGEIITALVGFLLVGLAFFVGYHYAYKNKMINRLIESGIGEPAGLYYQQTTGIQSFCRRNGYNMKVFPRLFKDKFSKEYNELEQIYKLKYKVSLADIADTYGENYQVLMQQGLENQFAVLREFLLYDMVRVNVEGTDDSGTPGWKSEYDNILTYADICRELDKSTGDEPYFQIFKDNLNVLIYELSK